MNCLAVWVVSSVFDVLYRRSVKKCFLHITGVISWLIYDKFCWCEVIYLFLLNWVVLSIMFFIMTYLVLTAYFWELHFKVIPLTFSTYWLKVKWYSSDFVTFPENVLISLTLMAKGCLSNRKRGRMLRMKCLKLA